MRTLVSWLGRHTARFGGDPDRLFLMGHSAGATHVAGYVFGRRIHAAEGHGLAGASLVSGRYRVHPEAARDPGLETVRSYFGADSTLYHSRSPVTHAAASDLPVLLVVAQYDPPDLARAAEELFAVLCQTDRGCPPFVRARYHNHMSVVLHFNTGDELLGREILAFVRRPGGETAR